MAQSELKKNPAAGELNNRLDRCLELIATWILLTSGIGLACALIGCFHAPQILIAALATTALYSLWSRNKEISFGVKPDWRHLAVLVLVCLFFRLPVYHYVLGAQDEGLYTNIAHYIEHTGGIKVDDVALQKLKGTGFQETYLVNNRLSSAGGYLPGVYTKVASEESLEFQFYHLFPVWMAFFIGIFGGSAGEYALTFFACVSVIFFYRLALLISGSSKVALGAGLLLAANPLHAFFSKFPVTEVPTLAFSLMGFTYLAINWSHSGKDVGRFLWISSACFGALFVTRISGFMYVPFIVALAAASSIADQDRVRSFAIFKWALVTVGLYIISVFYGLRWSSAYSADIYKASFEKIFSSDWVTGVVTTIALILGGWFLLAILTRSPDMRVRMARFFLSPARRIVSVVVGLGVAIGLFRIYQLGWTNHFSNDAWLAGLWHLSGSTGQAVIASSFFSVIVYLGPLIPAMLFVLLIRPQLDPRIEFLRFFAAGFLVYMAVLQWNIPYGPYYVRYLLSEIVPYSLLFVVLAWCGVGSRRWRKAGSIMLVLSLLYMGIASSEQIGKNENGGLYRSLGALLSPVNARDAILISLSSSASPTASEIKTPIIYTFGHNAISVSRKNLAQSDYLNVLQERYDDVYLFSDSAALPKNFVSYSNSRIDVWAFKPSHLLPHKLILKGSKRFYLSRLTSPIPFPIGIKQTFGQGGRWRSWLNDGWSNSEMQGTWSVGKQALLNIAPLQLPDSPNGVILHIVIAAFVTPTHPHQSIGVSVNGVAVEQHMVSYPSGLSAFDINLSRETTAGNARIRIEFALPDAASPSEVGASKDKRVLGIMLKSITALKRVAGG